MYTKCRIVSILFACLLLISPSSHAFSIYEMGQKVRETVRNYWVDATVTVATMAGFGYWYKNHYRGVEQKLGTPPRPDSWDDFGKGSPEEKAANDKGRPHSEPAVPFSLGSQGTMGVFGMRRFDLDEALRGYEEERRAEETDLVVSQTVEPQTAVVMAFRRWAYEAQTRELFGDAEPRGRLVRGELPREWIWRMRDGVVAVPGLTVTPPREDEVQRQLPAAERREQVEVTLEEFAVLIASLLGYPTPREQDRPAGQPGSFVEELPDDYKHQPGDV